MLLNATTVTVHLLPILANLAGKRLMVRYAGGRGDKWLPAM